MPFAALKGYYELILERERVPEPLRELSEDEAAELSRRMARVHRGSAVHVRHYDGEAYVMSAGIVTGIDAARRTLSVGRTAIPFDRIDGIALDKEDGFCDKACNR